MKELKLATQLALFFFLTAITGFCAPAGAASPTSNFRPGHIRTLASPEIRVTGKVNNSTRRTLHGHVPGALRTAQDKGRLAAKTPAEHLIMVLQSSDAQKAELRRVLDEQQDSHSANYHQWVTPEEFGQHFGVADSDIAQVSAWLQSQGFTVDDVAKSKRVLHFSGTVGQIENAFKTQMHSYQWHGETHVSNNSEISVPVALSPVISGVSLHNFFRKGHLGPVRRLKNLQANPLYSAGGNTAHYIGPWDFATIYNTFPLLNSGITGAGSSIAVVGRSDILLSDVQTYRQMFNLPVNDPIFIHAGPDNGIVPGDEGESDLDVEITGGIAPMAQVYFVIGTPTYLVDGITASVQYIVENNTADIMSISYGSCEGNSGDAGNDFNNQAFEQAAAQGISVFVSTGDNGPAECDNQNDSWENLGYATGSEASTPYTVAVGGSQGYEGTTAAQNAPYWSPTIQGAPHYGLSALGYVPEVPWNEAKNADTTNSASVSGLWAGSGGISSYYLRPSWQRGSGIVTTDDPALSNGGNWLTAYTITNPGSGYTTAPTVTFTGGGCVNEPAATATISGGSVTGLVISYGTQGGTLKNGQGFGCTSAPTITFKAAPTGGTTATAIATIGEMWNTPPLISGAPHRLTPDLVLNAASGHDGTLYCGEGICEISASGQMLDAGIVGGTSVAAPSMAGIQALINQANGGRQGSPNYIYYALAAAQYNQSATTCNASLGSAIGSSCVFHDITQGNNLICGTSTCSAANGKMGFSAAAGYDLASGLGSVNAANLSSQWKSVVFNSSSTTLDLSQTTGIHQGDPVTLSGSVVPSSGSGTPTGDVAFIVSQGILGQVYDVYTGDWGGSGTGAFTALSNGTYSATLSNLPAGTYTITARYAGDETYASSLSAPVIVTIAPGNSTVTITPEWFNDTVTCGFYYVTSYNYGQFAWIPAAVTSNTGSGVPTGTVTFTVDGAPYATQNLDPQGNGYLAAGTVSTSSCLYGYMFAQSPTLTGGTHVIGATYSGDSTFNPATATPVTITINKLNVGGTVSTGASFITSGASVPLTAAYTSSSLTGISPQSSGPTGTVTFTDTTTGTVLGTATVNPTVSFSGNTYTFAANAALTTTAITSAGAHSVVATYSGDTNFNPATSAALTITVGTPAATTTTVSSSANPTTLGGRPTFTATVTGTPAVTSGTVSFYDNYSGSPVLLGTGSVGGTHTATYRPATSTALFGGTHPITAVYGGIAANAGSTSAVFNQNVTLGTNTIDLTAKTQGAIGQNYTLTALLTPSSASALYSPNKSVVTFYDGATAIGTAQPITVTSSQGGYGLWTAPLTINSLTAGIHTITAQYSDINYSLATSGAQTVIVEGLNWAAPAAITYGTALSATQLNATEPVAGTFTYTPPIGTVLNSGLQTLSVTFTPTDTGHYVSQTATVQIQVNKAPLTVTANNASRAVGAANPAFTASYSGFVNGETTAVLSGSPSLTTTATSSSAAGTYPITAAAGTLAASNYSFAFVNGTLSVVASPSVSLTSSTTLTGSAATGYTLTITLKNPGANPVSNVVLTSATLGTTSGTPLPQSAGTLAAGGTAVFTVHFAGSTGADGAGVAEKFSGSYTGGTFATSLRSVTLP